MRILKTTEFKLFLTICLVLIPFITHYGGNFMADSMLSTTQAVLDSGSIRIDPYVKEGCKLGLEEKAPLFGCDHALDMRSGEWKWYSGFPPGSSFLALPAYAVLKPFTYLLPETIRGYPKFQIQTMLLNIIATLLIVIPISALLSVLLFRFSRIFLEDREIRIINSLLFSFGTIFFLYSTEFDPRVIGAFFSFAAFYMLFRYRTKEQKNWLLFTAGLFSSIAVTMEYMQLVLAGILFLYLLSFLRNRKVLYYMFGAIIPIVLMLCYHYAAFGNPFYTGYHFRQNHDKGVDVNTFSDFEFSNFWRYSFSPQYGLFFFMPILLFAIYGIYLGIKAKKELWREWYTIILIGGGYLLLISAFIMDSPCTFGPRYLITIVPFLMMGLPFAIQKLSKWLLIAVGGISVLINALPVLYMVENTGCHPGFEVFREFIVQIPHKGLSNYTFNLINQEIMPLNYLLVNAVNLILFALIGIGIWQIWKK